MPTKNKKKISLLVSVYGYLPTGYSFVLVMAGGLGPLCPGGFSNMALFQTQASSKASRVASSTTSDVSNLTLTCKRFAHLSSCVAPSKRCCLFCSVFSCDSFHQNKLSCKSFSTLSAIFGGLVNYVKIDPPDAHVLAFWSSENLSSRADHLRSKRKLGTEDVAPAYPYDPHFPQPASDFPVIN